MTDRICRRDGKPCDPYCSGGQCMTAEEEREYALMVGYTEQELNSGDTSPDTPLS